MMLILTLALSSSLWAAHNPRSTHHDLLKETSAIVDQIYGHHFELAQTSALALKKNYPQHPAGPLFLALVYYQQWQALGLQNDAVWQKVELELNLTLAQAKALEAKNPALSYYYQGAAYGFHARGLASQHRYLRAIPDATKSLSLVKKALELNPSLEDARLGLGMYHYFAAKMPLAAKPFASLLIGERADHDKGIAEIWQVANSTGIARIEARSALSMIFSRPEEANWKEANKLLVDLLSRYPQNPTYRLRKVYVLEQLGQFEEALKLADCSAGWIDKIYPPIRAQIHNWTNYRCAEINIFLGRNDEAQLYLSKVNEQKSPKQLKPWIKKRRENLKSIQNNNGLAGADHLPQTHEKEIAPFFAGY